MRLQEIHQKHLRSPKNDVVSILVSRSKITHDACPKSDCFFLNKIRSAFNVLNSFDWMQPLLKAVATAKFLNIAFDFNQNNVNKVAPTKSRNVKATTYYRSYIYIGAERLLDNEPNCPKTLGILAHEITHYALDLTYQNYGKPYHDNDLNRQRKFYKILRQCLSNRTDDINIDNIFKNYPENKFPEELVACVPQLKIEHEKNFRYMEKLNNSFKSLFKFFENDMLNDVDKSCDVLEAEQKIEELNERCVTLNSLDMSGIQLEENAVDVDFDTDEIAIVYSNIPRLTIKAFYDKKTKETNFKSSYIFTNMQVLKNDEIFESLVEAYNLPTKPAVIVDCDEASEGDVEELLHKFHSKRIYQGIILVINKLKSSNINFPYDKIEYEIKHIWNQLTAPSVELLMCREIFFQGKSVLLKSLLPKKFMDDAGPESLELLMGEQPIDIGNENFIRESNLQVERKSFSTSEHTTFNNQLNCDDLIATSGGEKVMMLYGEQDLERSSALHLIKRKLKEKFPLNWISFINLKNYKKDFEEFRKENLGDFDTAKFLAEKILKIKGFEAKVFNYMFNIGRVNILFDGYDSLSLADRGLVQDLMMKIKNNSYNQMWISASYPLVTDFQHKLSPAVFKISQLN